MIKYTLYIGANNETKEVDYGTINAVMSAHYQGYTIVKADGVWESTKEDSCVVTVFLDDDVTYGAVCEVVRDLCQKLEQYCILLEVGGKGELITV